MLMTSRTFTTGEVAVKGYLYVVMRGIVLLGRHVLTAGMWWGDDVLLYDESYFSLHSACAMSYVSALRISKQDLITVISKFPVAQRKVSTLSVSLNFEMITPLLCCALRRCPSRLLTVRLILLFLAGATIHDLTCDEETPHQTSATREKIEGLTNSSIKKGYIAATFSTVPTRRLCATHNLSGGMADEIPVASGPLGGV
jgi:hypothetical protein